MIGIGFDAKFVKPFIEGGFFKGELFVDSEKLCYEALNYRRFGYWELAKMAISSKWLSAKKKADELQVGGNTNQGDGFQNGGAIIVGKGGKMLYEYRQVDAADHISPEEIFKALDLKPVKPASTPAK